MARRDAYKQWEGYSAFRDPRREDDWNPFPARRPVDTRLRRPEHHGYAPAAPAAPPPIVAIAPKPAPPDFVNPPPSFEPNEWRGRYCRFHRDRGGEDQRGDGGWGRALSEKARW